METYSGWRKEKERLQSMNYEESSLRILSLKRKRGKEVEEEAGLCPQKAVMTWVVSCEKIHKHTCQVTPRFQC